jgi:hypothetical protein
MEELMAYAHAASAEGNAPDFLGQGTHEQHIFPAYQLFNYFNATDQITSNLSHA